MRQASKGQQGWGIFRPGIHGSTPPGVDAQTRAEICALWAACRPRQDRPACDRESRGTPARAGVGHWMLDAADGGWFGVSDTLL